MFKLIKWGIIGGAAVIAAGALFLGKDLFSYATSSGKMLRTAVKESIPVEFEIQRARSLLEDLIPELQENLRTVAREEVEVAHLDKEVKDETESLTAERGQIQKLRTRLTFVSTSGEAGQAELAEDLSLRFDRFRTAELLHAGKEKLLQNRRKSLHAAIEKLERTRLARVELAAQIEALEGQFRLIQAQSATSDMRLDTSKLAQTQRLLSDLKKRLEIAQRILERESRFGEPSPQTAVSPAGLAEEIDSYFEKTTPRSPEPAVTVRAAEAVHSGADSAR